MDTSERFDYLAAMKQLINYYYEKCEGSIMPLFFLYLARIAKPGKVLFKIEEKVSAPLDWATVPEDRYSSPILAQFTRQDAEELAKTDPSGGILLQRWLCNGMDHMSIVVLYKDVRLAEMRSAFQKHDEKCGDSMQKRQALFLFVQGLQKCPSAFLKKSFLELVHLILTRSNVYDESQIAPSDVSFIKNFYVAALEAWIMRGFEGKLFVPYSRNPYAAALLGKISVDTESSGKNANPGLSAMISEIILKGNGASKVNCFVSEKAYGSLGDSMYDGVILDYEHQDKNTRHTSWHKCLEVMKGNPAKEGYPPHLTDKARFVGIIDAKMLFRMVGTQKLFKEIINNKWLEGIILLPREYGTALVSVNKAKKNPDNVKLVNLYDTSPDLRYFRQQISRNSRTISIEKLSREQTTLESFFEESIPEKEGCRLVPLGSLVQPYLKTSLFGPGDSYLPDEVFKVSIDHETPYNPQDENCLVDRERVDCFSLYEPAYRLDRPSLLVNERGNLCPRLYLDRETAYFADGLAFSINYGVYPRYLVNELRKRYVLSQLRRWDKGDVHSIDDILSIRIHVPISESPQEEERRICEAELDSKILPVGEFIMNEANFEESYRIERFLHPGGFGLTYMARDLFDELVVLKEYFAHDYSFRFDGMKVALPVDGSLESMKKGSDLYGHLVKFREEAKTLHEYGGDPANRLVHSSEAFYCRETNTWYYTMPYYKEGSLTSYLKNHGPFAEADLIEHVVKPVAVALNVLHNKHWLHLDINPNNILMDDNGYAVLGDMGVSQHYDEADNRDTVGGEFGTPGFVNELQRTESFNKKFHPELDVYSLAMTIYWIFSREDLDEFDYNCLELPGLWDMSDKLRLALQAALDPTLKRTPKSIPDFMHLVPGCEDMAFKATVPHPKPISKPRPVSQPVESGMERLLRAIGRSDLLDGAEEEKPEERLEDFT